MFSRQCDEEGIKQNGLVATYHCMHTPGGPLKYSLGKQTNLEMTLSHRSGSQRWIIGADRPAYLVRKKFTKESAACCCILQVNQSIEV